MGKARAVVKTAGVASMSAPSVRAVLEDEKLRKILKDLAGTVNDLYGRVSTTVSEEGLRELPEDDRIRKDLDRLLSLLREGAQRTAEDVRPKRKWGRWTLIVVGGTVVLIWLAARRRS